MPHEPVLMVHGVGSSFDHNWRATGWVDILEGEGRDVIGVTLPGHGVDSVSPSEDPADAVLRGCPSGGKQVDAVGFSAGGHALLRAAARCPAAFRRIAVLGVGDPTEGDNGAQLGDIVDGLEADEEPSSGTARTIRRLAVGVGNDRFAVARFLRAERPPLSVEELAEIRLPALVVLGENDFAGTAAGLVGALPAATLVTLPRTDHFATPTNFHAIETVVRFLAE
ncbi:alpha/beta hydrolase [Rhodococcus sp. ACPA4]|uniref:alpha/beta fold hydrolase n=1 Tax=Rhodococcus sp. ACPA4 TaxID=2028571 RepID=UPI000BB148FE|nr:alpha/beta hydrolase [Rhodococcus sp. ACPA4]MDJ0105399.1 alpha/beta hydrolase [Rhodococcus erythropolis]PBC43122.1 alpha/beta hydrolase [Rhodococcus sp. ACPA4]